jgi:hypothetical protein
VELANLVRDITEDLEDRLWIESRAVGRDPTVWIMAPESRVRNFAARPSALKTARSGRTALFPAWPKSTPGAMPTPAFSRISKAKVQE